MTRNWNFCKQPLYWLWCIWLWYGAMRPLSCLCYVSLWWYLLRPLLLSIEDLTVLYLITVHCSLSYNLAVAVAKDALKIDTAV